MIGSDSDSGENWLLFKLDDTMATVCKYNHYIWNHKLFTIV